MNNHAIPAEKIREILDDSELSDEVLKKFRDLTDPPLPDPLFGARATHPQRGEGIVISHFPNGSEVRFFFRSDKLSDGTSFRWVDISDLTFHTSEIS